VLERPWGLRVELCRRAKRKITPAAGEGQRARAHPPFNQLPHRFSRSPIINHDHETDKSLFAQGSSAPTTTSGMRVLRKIPAKIRRGPSSNKSRPPVFFAPSIGPPEKIKSMFPAAAEQDLQLPNPESRFTDRSEPAFADSAGNLQRTRRDVYMSRTSRTTQTLRASRANAAPPRGGRTGAQSRNPGENGASGACATTSRLRSRALRPTTQSMPRRDDRAMPARSRTPTDLPVRQPVSGQFFRRIFAT